MKRILITTLVGCCSALFVDCSSLYVKNRLNDAADIFTVEVETRAYGASARVGPVKAGAYYKSPQGAAWGLRGGNLGVQNSAEFTALLFGADYHLANKKDLPGLKADNSSGESMESDPEAPEELANLEELTDATPPLLYLRQKELRAAAPFGTVKKAHHHRSLLKESNVFARPHYFTQLEITIGLFFGIKLGFNPGELLDFLLGWFTIDIFEDDAPYLSEQLREFKKSPYWKDLDPEVKKKLTEEF